MPYWDHEEERRKELRLPFVIHITREKCQVCLYDGPGFSLLCDPPPDCLKSLGESRKVCTPLQGRQRIFNPLMGYFYF